MCVESNNNNTTVAPVLGIATRKQLIYSICSSEFQQDAEIADHDRLHPVLKCTVSSLAHKSDQTSSSVNCLPLIVSPLSAEGLAVMVVHNPAS